MQLVKEVCHDEGLDFRTIGKNGNLAEVRLDGRPYFFAYTTTPFNREDTQHICSDKFLTHELVAPKLSMPKTKRYLRPDLNPSWHDTIEFGSEAEIVADMLENFPFPFIIKMNMGSLGRNIFKCKSKLEAEQAVKKIFEEDWALLAQEWVDQEREFRVLVLNNSVELAYYKGAEEFFGKGDGAFDKIKVFLEPLQGLINLGWAGLDVILDKKGKLWLIELNTKPSLISAIKLGKKDLLKPLYKKAFKEILA